MRKTSFLLLVASAIILFPDKVLATQWVRILSTDEFVLHIDVDSIKIQGNQRQFWEKSIYFNTKKLGDKYINASKSFSNVDCLSKTYRTIRAIGYDLNGSIVFDIDTRLSSYTNSNDEIVPGTLGDSISEFVCSRKTDNSYSDDVSSVSGLSRQQAINLVNKWLKEKRQIFSPPFNQSMLSELTTGKLYNDSINSIAWLRNNNARYQYGFQKIESVESFSSSGTQATLKVRIAEDSTLFVNGRMDSKSSGLKTQTIKYNLQFVNGAWKIEDY